MRIRSNLIDSTSVCEFSYKTRLKMLIINAKTTLKSARPTLIMISDHPLLLRVHAHISKNTHRSKMKALPHMLQVVRISRHLTEVQQDILPLKPILP